MTATRIPTHHYILLHNWRFIWNPRDSICRHLNSPFQDWPYCQQKLWKYLSSTEWTKSTSTRPYKSKPTVSIQIISKTKYLINYIPKGRLSFLCTSQQRSERNVDAEWWEIRKLSFQRSIIHKVICSNRKDNPEQWRKCIRNQELQQKHWNIYLSPQLFIIKPKWTQSVLKTNMTK